MVAVIAGIVLIAIGIPDTFNTFGFLENSTRVTGHVVTSTPYTDAKGNLSFCPMLAFRTTGGTALQAEAGQVCQGSPFTVGQAIALRYQNDKPTNIRADSLLGIWGNTIFLLGGGLLIEVVAAAIFIWRRGRR